MKITSRHKNQFLINGWTQVDCGLTDIEIERFRKGVEKLRDKAFKINYPFTFCYYPHIRTRNIAGIELPFNKLVINDDVKEFFRIINLGDAIRELMNWDKTYITLSRLFTMKSFNYRSQWHRDRFDWDGNITTMKEIQIGIFLKEQKGFSIFK